MWLTKLNSGDNGRPGSVVDGTAEGLAPFSRVVDPIPPPTVVLLTSAGSVTAFDRRRPLAIVSSLACSRPLRNTMVWLRQPETVPLSLGTPRATSADPGTFETMTTRHEP
eukprot:scaffold52051_cov68-Phaeocystis_antarctica.AAC.1